VGNLDEVIRRRRGSRGRLVAAQMPMIEIFLIDVIYFLVDLEDVQLRKIAEGHHKLLRDLRTDCF
jgi:hypothetical protein